MNAPSPPHRAKAAIGLREFVAMMAALMAVNALGVDLMLPALPNIAHDLGVTVENHQQWVIAAYVGGFGVAQIVYGPIADRFGRRPVLLTALAFYAAMSFLAAFAGSFSLLLLARVLQGIASSGTRILTISIVRDSYVGRRMARVLSLTYMIFLAVPIFAPMGGQLILWVAPWPWIFYALALFTCGVTLWVWCRLPETLAPGMKRPASIRSIAAAMREAVSNRNSLGYSLAYGVMFGSLLAFVNSAQQLVHHVFHAPELFTLCFATMGIFLASAALLNSRIVERFGTRKVSHSALVLLIVIGLARLATVLTGIETLVSFTLFQGLCAFCFGLSGSNFGAMAMEEMGGIAGTASSVQGFLSTCIGTLVSLAIGQSFVDSTLPLTVGVVVCSFVCLAMVFVTERGRLFRAHHLPPASEAAQ